MRKLGKQLGYPLEGPSTTQQLHTTVSARDMWERCLHELGLPRSREIEEPASNGGSPRQIEDTRPWPQLTGADWSCAGDFDAKGQGYSS